MAVTEMSKVERATLTGVCSTILLTAGCAAAERDVERPSNTAATSAATPKPTSAGCSVTRPTTEGIPTGVRQTYDGPAFGQEQLWVGAWWSDEALLEEARQHGGIKYPSFTIQDDDVTDELGPPQVSAKRLDGGGEIAGDTGGYATAKDDSGKTLHWWPTGIQFSGPGCWRITETVGSTSITYVVDI
ncbi:hypothetical protein KMZ32_03895 [Phycicoccus sp. MAQZ13P-2]|uniref:hypothetical protein n=1 Tax=Phycicoccus mangrovi TaxID=2840470 RepID=UPI001C004F48|nr:hypothetical protein [Phycicoccus mangrovi]MBT9254581.1 hypothetical protein [Phycicoccus mangrovi]MBT9273214.1 hypothetical protein [Phycicoccus mangrovi]